MANIEDLNRAIAAVEKLMLATCPGVTAAVRVDKGLEQHTLMLGKRGTSWGLYFNESPILKCSKEIRLLAANHLKALFDELRKQEAVEQHMINELVKHLNKMVEEYPICPCGSGLPKSRCHYG